jgi:serine/threonine protein kinase
MKSTRRIRRVSRRKHTRRHKKRGGTIIGNGQRGFVVDPPIACEGKDMTGYVSKIFNNKKVFMNVKARLEPVVAKLKEIDPHQKHFIYPEFCDTPGALTPENITDGVNEENKHWGYLMKKGGMTLQDYLMATPNRPMSNDAVASFIKTNLNDVIESVKLLHANTILHNDLHLQNVLRMDDKTFRLIDFDDSFVITEEEKQKQFRGWYSIPSDEDIKNRELNSLIGDIVMRLNNRNPDAEYVIEKL